MTLKGAPAVLLLGRATPRCVVPCVGGCVVFPTRSLTTRSACGLPRPVTRSYPGPAEYAGRPVLVPLVISWKSLPDMA